MRRGRVRPDKQGWDDAATSNRVHGGCGEEQISSGVVVNVESLAILNSFDHY